MLDLGPIESRRKVALATADMVALLAPAADGPTRVKLMKEVAMAGARSSADVDDLVEEIRRLRKEHDG